jgi:ribosome-binding protein aMBF1 (putative translation factor)
MQLRPIIHMTVEGHEYVAVPREEFERMRPPASGGNGNVEALSYTRLSIGKALVDARKAAGITQVELAKRLGKSQTLVAHAERGTTRVSERYAASVIRACGLPDDWPATDPKVTGKKKALAPRAKRRSS